MDTIKKFSLALILFMMATLNGYSIECFLAPEGPDFNNYVELQNSSNEFNQELTFDLEEADIPAEEVIVSYNLFNLEKDYNRKNVLHYDIKVKSPSCTIALNGKSAPALDPYWRMGEEKGQRKNLTSKDKKRFAPIVIDHDPNRVRFKMPVFNKLPINKKVITVETEIAENGKCKVIGYYEKNDGTRIVISKVFADLNKILGIPTGVDKIIISGSDLATGKRVKPIVYDQ